MTVARSHSNCTFDEVPEYLEARPEKRKKRKKHSPIEIVTHFRSTSPLAKAKSLCTQQAIEFLGHRLTRRSACDVCICHFLLLLPVTERVLNDGEYYKREREPSRIIQVCQACVRTNRYVIYVRRRLTPRISWPVGLKATVCNSQCKARSRGVHATLFFPPGF